MSKNLKAICERNGGCVYDFLKNKTPVLYQMIPVSMTPKQMVKFRG
jgi:hypothetical protein